MTAREQILSRIVDQPSEPIQFAPLSHAQPQNLWAQFESQLTALGGKLIDAQTLKQLAQGVVFAEPSTGFASTVDSIWDAEVGISRAEFAIAEAGSLVVSSAPGYTRLSTLLPPISIVIVDQNQIVATLAQALDRMPTRNAVIISGTSRTADIEGVLVRGVHGPGELLIYRSPA